MPITHQSPLFLRGRYLRHLGWVIFATVTLQGLLLYLALPVATGIAARTVQSFSNPFMRAVNWLSALGAIGILLFPVEFTQFSRRMFVLGSCYAALVGDCRVFRAHDQR